MESHASVATAALRAGKHVLVEKPMGVSLAEAGALLETARSSPGMLVCAPFVMFSPTYRILWEQCNAAISARC